MKHTRISPRVIERINTGRRTRPEPHACVFCHLPMKRIRPVSPGISHFECASCNHSATQRDESPPPPAHRLVGKHPALAAPYGGKLQAQLNQLRNMDYALIARRMMAHLR